MVSKQNLRYTRLLIIGALVIGTLILGCADEKSMDQWIFDIIDPGGETDYSPILIDTITDGVNDLELLPPDQAGPPYSLAYDIPSVDVTQIALGIQASYFYLRVDFRGIIPTDNIPIIASGEVEAQMVTNQGMNIALNTDNDPLTGGGGEGVSGIDIFFAVAFDYDAFPMVYCNYDFASNDVHDNQQQLYGQVVQGGPGYNYILVRYDISTLGSFFPRGSTVDLGEWSEAESYNADGSLKYHHFAFDPIDSATTWTIPAE